MAVSRRAPARSAEVACDIVIKGNRGYITGTYPVKVIKDVTSYYVEGYQFSPLFRRRKWDGKEHLFHPGTGSFPSGLLTTITNALKEYNELARVNIIDEREDNVPTTGNNGFELIGIEFGKGKYDYQLAAAEAMIKHKRGIVKIATNGGKTAIAAAVIKHLSIPSLFLVDRLELLYQIQDRFSKWLGIPVDSIGIIGDGEYSVGKWITVATPTSLLSKIENKLLDNNDLNKWQLLIGDEIHHGGSNTSAKAMALIPAYWRWGFSGTPLDRSDGANLRIISQTGEIIYEVSNKLLVERGISVQPYVEVIKIDKPILPKSLTWQKANEQGVVMNPHLNEIVVEKAVEHTELGKRVVIMVDQIKHGNIISKWLTQSGLIKHQFINGNEDTETRRRALKDLESGKLKCLIATSILNEGIDSCAIEVLILAGGGKAKISLLQRAGRGLRTGEGKDKLLIIDFANFTHKYLLKHSMARLKIFRREECFVISTGS